MADPASSRRAIDAPHPSTSFSADPPAAPLQPLAPTDSKPVAAAESDAAAEPDTCRICRGEAGPAEPLFFPCKCSGSIKYVHQDCLMEWLSHSQKKHCELCKTPFRFTKLYSPKMPPTIPAHIFFCHMLKHLAAGVVVWSRAALVTTVWLCLLPYLMRSVWAFYFWFSDQGLSGPRPAQVFYAPELNPLSQLYFTGPDQATCPSTPLLATRITRITELNAGEFFRPDAAWPWSLSLEEGFQLGGAVAQIIGNSFRMLLGSKRTSIFDGLSLPPPRRPTLLSEVGALRGLTRSPMLNAGVILVLEGQIITVLVIICFILIILVRDYVVQQQPEINMRAAAAFGPVGDNDWHIVAAAVAAAPDDDDLDRGLRDDDDAHVQERLPAPEPAPAPTPTPEYYAAAQDDDDDPVRERDPAAGSLRRAGDDRQLRDVRREPVAMPGNILQNTLLNGGGGPRLPRLPSYDEGDGNARPEQTSGRVGVEEVLKIWHEADSNYETFLRILGERGMGRVMEGWTSGDPSVIFDDTARDAPTAEASASARPPPEAALDDLESPIPLPGANSDAYTSDQEEVPDAALKGKGKGKGKAGADDPVLETAPRRRFDVAALRNCDSGPADERAIPAATTPKRAGSPSRRGSNVDGADVPGAPSSPLAACTWTFANLPETRRRPDTEGAEGPSDDEEEEGGDDGYDDDDGDGDELPGGGAESAGRAWSVTVEVSDIGRIAVLPAPIPRETAQDDDVPVRQVADAPVQQAADDPVRHAADDLDLHATTAAIALGEAQRPRRRLQGFFGRVADFMFADIEAPEDAPPLPPVVVVRIPDNEPGGPPFVDGVEEMEDERDEGPENAADVDDMEDFDGVMELLGMRGPLMGLFQNALFCAVLVSLTIFMGIFLPYNVGKFVLWLTANPSSVAKSVFELSKLIQDAGATVVGTALYLGIGFAYVASGSLGYHGARLGDWTSQSRDILSSASGGVCDTIYSDVSALSTALRDFSAVSHQALIQLKHHAGAGAAAAGRTLVLVGTGDVVSEVPAMLRLAAQAAGRLHVGLADLHAKLADPSFWFVRGGGDDSPADEVVIRPDLAVWSGSDRLLAIALGYLAIFTVAAVYLRRRTHAIVGNPDQEWEASVIDMLNQASGVMKVIVIISIEMLVFPLYCGLLLDAALLPLFENATVMSRVLFTYNHPFTSAFVHWFVGTGYMFHFALFVSMCRKVMRKGVLYFIRDTDDPDFHPVRDVLERSLVTQLRKILFSAFVYGALVIVCLGGVVWGLWYSVPDLLPVHYSSNEPVLEFPIDLLFYNFVVPLAVKLLRPTEVLHAMYTWWFHKCARALRLTWFLFGERRLDEEGTLRLHADSKHQGDPWWRTMFLEIRHRQVVPRRWDDLAEGAMEPPRGPIDRTEFEDLTGVKLWLVQTGQLVESGRLVRTPASDQVRIHRNMRVFRDAADIDEAVRNGSYRMLPGASFASAGYQLVYVPPSFRTRIFLFIASIWLFAAVTGVGLTVGPLMLGRRMFKSVVPGYIRTNDIYAFSLGIYVFGAAVHGIVHARVLAGKASAQLSTVVACLLSRCAPAMIARACVRTLRLAYAYSMLLVVFPFIVSALVELYVILPAHTVMYPPALRDGVLVQTKDARHTVPVIQTWTLGVLYMRFAYKHVREVYEDTRPAMALEAVLRHGLLRPDLGVLTRAFVMPGLCLGTLALCGPALAARILVSQGYLAGYARDPVGLSLVYRAAYPAAAFLVLACFSLDYSLAAFRKWTVRIRDEAYLIGERLHNFGVRTSETARARAPGWGAGGNRL